MALDICESRVRQLVIKAGQQRRKDLGLPEESNITTIYNEMAPLLGIAPILMSSRDMNHLPAPHEMKDARGNFVVPRKDCPVCGEKDSVILTALCMSCKDAEGGKFKSAWVCQSDTCKDKEGGFKEISEKAFVQWLGELGVEIPIGPKANFGIKTMTDEGLK